MLGMNALSNRLKLTAQEASFVRAVASGSAESAAVDAYGLAAGGRKVSFADVSARPHVAAAIHLEVRRRLVAAAPIALKTILAIVENGLIPPKTRLDAAKTLLDRAGHVPPRVGTDHAKPETPLHELSLVELRTLADKLEGEIASRARVIEPTKGTAAANSVDLLG